MLTSLLIAPTLHAQDSLSWDKAGGKVSANIDNWPVQKALKKIAGNTGWEIFMEPDLSLLVRTRFKNLDQEEALRRITSPLNFALVPEKNAPDRLYIFSTDRNRATERLESDDSSRIEDELILMLEDGADADDIARKLNGTIIGSIGDLNAYRLKFNDSNSVRNALDQISQMDDVNADFNYSIERPPSPMAMPGATAFPLNLNPSPTTREDAIIIGLIDTAIQLDGSPYADFVLEQLAVGAKSVTSSIYPTHATHVLDALFTGYASASSLTDTIVRVVSVDVYGNQGSTSTFDVTDGAIQAVEAGATVLNFSLGGPDETDYFKAFVENMTESGIIITAAAGNQGSSTPSYPAAYPEAVSVTAVDTKGNLTSYANTGSTVDAVGPGTNLAEFSEGVFRSEGTSVAAPHVAGATAARIEAGLSPAAASQSVVEAAPYQPAP
ncbi:S8 family serine peptidase [Verrucomicrobia bacterium]|nr:S8 family serine peptidase [Verrucomicrobiota bacterium]